MLVSIPPEIARDCFSGGCCDDLGHVDDDDPFAELSFKVLELL